ncbi:Nucleoporin nup49/NSP49 (Nuclear pore protein nup49/NSP49) [Vanrija albida]|uniref:Nucleoporin nup49/NSP49 (Nuclear pore protein nup49/NSP49) n=1 Tax=Vanrija albida TaxID=181172 RepID=A0ABR3QG62_9TREE
MSFGFGKPAAAPAAAPAATSVPSFSISGPSNGAPAPAASGFGSFGAKPATGGGLFGSTPAAPAAAPAGSSLFGSAAAAPAPATTGLFGAAKPAASTGFGGFGQPAAAAQPAAGGGLFGQPQQQQQQPAQQAGTSSLFARMSNPAQPQQQAAGGLFGQQQQQQPATGGGLFGQQQQQQQPTAGGLFGQQQQQQPQQQTGGLFGQASTTQPSTGLFGAKPATTGLFGTASTSQAPAQSSMFGQPQPLAQSAAPQSSGLPKSTKYADLPEQWQKGIDEIDNFIKDRKQIGASIVTENIGRAIWQTSSDVKAASDETAAIAQGLESLKYSLEQLAIKVSSEMQDLQKLLETWEAAKPVDARHSEIRPLAHRDFPQEYFFRVAQGEQERVTRYKRTITMLTRAVTSLANDHDNLSPQVVAQTIQNNQQAILSLAGQLEGLQLRMNDLRNKYTDMYVEVTSSMRNPFEVAREEKGLSLLGA